jgi:hypothetical protein
VLTNKICLTIDGSAILAKKKTREEWYFGNSVFTSDILALSVFSSNILAIVSI